MQNVLSRHILLCCVLISSLRSVIEKPPILGKELVPLSGHSLTGFRLHPGPVCTLFLCLAPLLASSQWSLYYRWLMCLSVWVCR